MKNRFLFTIHFLLLVLFSTSAYSAWTEQQIRDILIERIDAYEKSVGMVVGFLDGNESIIVGYGAFSDSDDRVPDGNTLYEIGSISKVFTATLLADMVRRGDMGIDDPVQQYLPDSVILPTWGNESFTPYHLTTHTSGLPRLPDNINPADPTNPYADYSVENMYSFLGNTELLTRPGETWLYSNLGVGLLGHVLALQAEMEYEQLVTERITQPLGMNDTVITLSEELAARMAQGHDAGLIPTPNWDIPTLAGAGAIRSTAADLLLFLKANLADQNSSIIPALQDTHEPLEQVGSWQIGMGWFVGEVNGKTIREHGGSTGGFTTYVAFDQAAGTAVVVLSNASGPIHDIGIHILASTNLSMYKSPDDAVQVSREVLDKLSGEYELSPTFILKFWREGDLFFVRLGDLGIFQVYAESDTKFFTTAYDTTYTFYIDPQGNVVHVVHQRDGVIQYAPRIESLSFTMNAGLNDAWYDPATDGQGFFVTVLPELGKVSIAWFTYDTTLPDDNADSNLGDPGHRWLTALGSYSENEAVLDIVSTSGGLFDAYSEIERTIDGTIILKFDDCASGTVEYNIPSINQQGIVPIQRVVDDNIELCEILATDIGDAEGD